MLTNPMHPGSAEGGNRCPACPGHGDPGRAYRLVLGLLAVSLLLGTLGANRAHAVQAALSDSFKVHNTSIKAFPYLYYTPETQLAIGVGGIATFYTSEDEELRPSNISLSGYYTTNDQYQFTLHPKFYFAQNRYFAGVKLTFGHYVSKFYGIGPETPDIDTAEYGTDRNGLELNIEMPPVFFVSDRSGFVYNYQYSGDVDPEDNPYLLSGEVTGSDGGTSSGMGAVLVWDRRDSSFYPTKGDLDQITAIFYTSATGSDFIFWTMEVDDRRYIPLAPGKVLALETYVNIAVGDAPFDMLPALGGQHRMRGYFEGRFVDHAYLMGQVEYRQLLTGPWGFVAFAALGNVAPDLTLFQGSSFKFAGGVGLRFLFNKEEHVNLRVDFGVGNNSNGVYFGLEEAF